MGSDPSSGKWRKKVGEMEKEEEILGEEERFNFARARKISPRFLKGIAGK